MSAGAQGMCGTARPFVSADQRVDVAEMQLSIVDVKCTDFSGRRFVVEIRVLKVEGIEKRVVYNASKAHVMQLRAAEEYPASCDVVGVTICNFDPWPEKNDDGTGYRVPMLSRWQMRERHCGELGLPQIQYVFLELPKYAAGDAPMTLIDKWAYFFREAKNLDIVPPALSESPFRDALEVALTATFSADEWEVYERAKMAEQDARGALTVAYKEGVAEGHAEGHKSGLTEGLAAGKRDSLLRILELRGIALTEEERNKISRCADIETLDRWLRQALTASAGAEVLA